MFPFARCLVLIAVLLCFFATGTLRAQTAVIPSGTYQIVPKTSASSCIDVAGPSQTPGALAQLYTCGNPTYSLNQVFQVTSIQSSTGVPAYQLISAYSGQCLDVDGVSTQNGAHLQQYTCGGKSSLNQLWTFGAYNGGYQLVSVNSSACLDLPGGSLTPGNPLQQWSCGGGQNPNQLWELVPTTAAPPVVTPPSATSGISSAMFNLSVLSNMTSSVALTFNGTRSQDSYPNVNWRDLEPIRGGYNFANLDLYISANTARGTDMLYTFNAIPNWASSNPSLHTSNGDAYCAPPTDLSDWDDFVRAIATHSAGRIRYWEVWNEPQYYYCGSMATLVTMAQHAASIIKSVDPNAIIVSPAGTTSGGPAMLTSFLAEGGGAYVDVIACHGYGYNADENLVTTLTNYINVMQANGVSAKPLWDTESSWNGTTNAGTAAGRAAYVAKSYLLHASLGLARFYWYAYDSSETWGGLTVNGTGAPEVAAYRETRRWLMGATITSPCAAAGAIWTCTLTRPNGYTARVLWNPNSTSNYTVATGYTQYRTISGTVVSVAAGNIIPIANQPILLETASAF